LSCILLLDRGNDSLKAAHAEPGGPDGAWRIETFEGHVELSSILSEAAPVGVAYSSVVPSWTRYAGEQLASSGVKSVLEAGPGVDLPFELLIEHPESLGPDRICCACGAVAMGLGEAVIVDAGTAVTVDVLSAGAFRGGAIYPGLDLVLDSLHRGTAALPHVTVDSGPPELPASNTVDAIASGAVFGIAGAVRALVERSLGSAGPDSSVLMTGGRMEIIKRHIGLEVVPVPDLLFRGLLYLYLTNLR